MPYRFTEIDTMAACTSLNVNYSGNKGNRIRNLQVDAGGHIGGLSSEASRSGIMDILRKLNDTIDGKGVKSVEVAGRKNFDFGSMAIVYVERDSDEQATVWYDPEGDEMWISNLNWAKRKVGIG